MTTMKMPRFSRRLIVAAIAVPAFVAIAAGTRLDTARSSVIATFKQEGVPVDAPFGRFSGVIVYDPNDLSGSSASLEVETGSLDIGDAAYNAEARKKAWFDSAAFPKATYRSTAIKAGTAAGQFVATGTLTIKGKAQTVTVPIKAVKQGSATAFDGTLAISRQVFGIGDPAWEDVLEDKVSVRFHLVVAEQS